MKLDEAIEILTLKTQGRDILPKLMEIEAQKLGIEALKAWGEARKDPDFTIAPYLPGETDD